MNKKVKKGLIGVLIIILLVGSGFGGYFLYRKFHPKIIKPFPDPFVFNNGTRVDTVGDWVSRRNEIKETLATIEYGHMPGRPDAINATLRDTEIRSDGSKLNTLMLTIIPFNSTPDLHFNMTLWLYVPEGEAPFPAIIKVSSDGTGSQTQINQTIVDRGYIFACYNHTALDPDTGGYDVDGPAQKAYPNYDWGSLAVWAWGAMRIADLLVGESWVAGARDFSSHKVDTEKLIVTGHSRRGKTALLAAAYDERFAMVVPNGSGCGGCGSFLVQGPFSETIKMITSEKRFKSWFHEDFGKYGGNEEALPFDQHFIRALIAPRYIISTDGLQDYWANPTGTKAVHEASQPVFDFLNASDNNGIHYRDGGHGFLQEDFAVLLNFADKMLLGKNISDDFYMDPFDEDFPIEYSIPK